MTHFAIRQGPLKRYNLFIALLVAVSALGIQPAVVVKAAAVPTSSPVEAGAYVVDTYGDDESASACTSAPGDCSLRGAINKANSHPGGDTILLPEGQFTLYGSAGDDNNKGGDLDILESGGSVTLIGAGINKTTISGNYADRIIDEIEDDMPINITLKSLTITEAGFREYPANGGAIRMRGTLDLDLVNINHAIGKNGGAIYIQSDYDDTLTINRSIFSFNTATLDGGVIYNVSELAKITNSTFDHNKASGVAGVLLGNDDSGRGGAIFNKTNLEVTASTFAYNTGKKESASIINYAFEGQHSNAYIKNSTFNLNSTAIMNYTNGNGIKSTAAVTTITNTILANSTETENCVNKVEVEGEGKAAIINGGYNLDSGISCGFENHGGSQFGKDPLLDSLEDNGGPTPTMAIRANSPAIDKANPALCPHRDQRGLADVGGYCDIGAFEYGASPIMTPLMGTLRTTLKDGETGLQMQVLLTNQLGNPLEGWLVTYEIPGGVHISLSDDSALTNAAGLAWVYAAYDQGTGVSSSSSATLISHTGGGSSQFVLNRYGGATPNGHAQHGLPLTGFAPGRVSALPPQPADKAYTAEGDLNLAIPSLGITLPVVGIPKTSDGWNTTWLSNQAGYLEGTAFPSWQGNSVVTGHVTLADGTAGPFAKLGSLKWGDRIVVTVYGTQFVYEVRSVKSVAPDDMSVLGHHDEPWLTLITCQDFDPAANTYLKRLAVSAVLIQSGNS